MKEVVEVVKAVKNAPQERISGKIGEHIDDDVVLINQPGDQARRDPQACGVAATGPSASNFCEDSGIPDLAVHRQNSGRASDVAATGPSNQTVAETVEVSPVPFVNRVVKAPVIMQTTHSHRFGT